MESFILGKESFGVTEVILMESFSSVAEIGIRAVTPAIVVQIVLDKTEAETWRTISLNSL